MAGDGFDNVRQAPSVEFLDGNALDLLVGSRDTPPLVEETQTARKGASGEPRSGTALADLLVDGQGDSDLENVAWSDAESESGGDPTALQDDLGTIEDTLDLEDLELPDRESTESGEAAPAAIGGPTGD